MPMSAGLASGLALSSFGVVSAALAWGFGGALRNTGQFGRGLFDSETHRWDPLARRAGYGARRAMMRAAMLASRRENQVKRSA
jgi:type IV secretion system protein VirB6